MPLELFGGHLEVARLELEERIEREIEICPLLATA
jgi:hypothetical protein